MKKEYLLCDEKSISNADYVERKKIVSEFQRLPEDFFSKLRHFQPQIGCLNACAICSKYASKNMNYWTESRIRNVIAAIKYSTPAKQLPLIVWERENHRNGVIFSYLDNDVGNYYYLNKFIEIAYNELGVKTRISTVGYSRHNKELNRMHQSISKKDKMLAGVRLSFTPYAIGWNNCHSEKLSRDEYEKDMANFFKIYKKYYEKAGSGSRKFCIELRYKPLCNICDIFVFRHNKKFIICSDSYLYISEETNVSFSNTYIEDPKNHRLSLTNTGKKFFRIPLKCKLKTKNEIIKYISDNYREGLEKVEVYRVKNHDGYYYSVEPELKDTGGYGINFYPKSSKRKISGYIVLERFFLNVLFEYKKSLGLKPNEKLENATWKDVNNVINNLKLLAEKYKTVSLVKSNYITKEILVMIQSYANALKIAGYKPNVFFDKDFTIDTGIICNLGRAIKEFKGLVTIENEPLTLNHERNYGKYNSNMTVEDVSWRLSCDYDDNIVIEKLNMANTATKEGQVTYTKRIELDKKDEKLNIKDVKTEYLIPGQRKYGGNE